LTEHNVQKFLLRRNRRNILPRCLHLGRLCGVNKCSRIDAEANVGDGGRKAKSLQYLSKAVNFFFLCEKVGGALPGGLSIRTDSFVQHLDALVRDTHHGYETVDYTIGYLPYSIKQSISSSA
jgi:hypothetical protein